MDGARLQGDGQAQRHVRRVSSANEITSVYLFTPDAVLLTYVSQRGVECAPEPPLTAVDLPLKTGSEWTSTGRCGDVRIELGGKVVARERITVAGRTIETFQINLATDIRSPEIAQTTGMKAWVSPDHRLVVRSEEVSRGTYNGAPYSSELDSEILSLTPA